MSRFWVLLLQRLFQACLPDYIEVFGISLLFFCLFDVGPFRVWFPHCGFFCKCRFKVDVSVSDGREDAVFVLFDSDVHFILGKSCAQVLEVSKVVRFNLYLIFILLPGVF